MITYPPGFGSAGAGAGVPINLSPAQLLTAASGNFTVPAGVTQLRGAMTGAGGGGGGVSAAAATGSAGLPGVITSFVLTVTPGQVIAFTNGAGGAKGANTGGNGGTGGDTTFGSFTAKGGVGGNGSTSGNAAVVNAPISVGVGVPAIFAMMTGSAAIPTAAAFLTGLSGSISYNGLAGAAGVGGQGKGLWGTGGTPGTNGSATDATGYGAGGSAAGSTSNTAGTGALGAPGAIVLY